METPDFFKKTNFSICIALWLASHFGKASIFLFSKSFPEVIILIYPGFRSENVCYTCDFKSIDAVFMKGRSYPTVVGLELQQPLLIDELEE